MDNEPNHTLKATQDFFLRQKSGTSYKSIPWPEFNFWIQSLTKSKRPRGIVRTEESCSKGLGRPVKERERNTASDDVMGWLTAKDLQPSIEMTI